MYTNLELLPIKPLKRRHLEALSVFTYVLNFIASSLFVDVSQGQ
jgi:hypothetical protein